MLQKEMAELIGNLTSEKVIPNDSKIAIEE